MNSLAILLYALPIFAIVSGMYVYRHNGKRDFLKLDLVQFFYAFILAPMMFVWMKTLLFVLLRSEINFILSQTQLFVFDSLFSLLFVYIYAFFVMHSLTKTFRLKLEKDPLYDLFIHSEYIHLILSHVVVVVGTFGVFTIIALVNIWFPLAWNMNQEWFYLVNGSGFLVGTVAFLALWLTDPRQSDFRYMRLIKLTLGIFFLILVSGYFTHLPTFNSSHMFYWWITFAFSAMVFWSFFTYRSVKIKSLFQALGSRHQDTDWWGKNREFISKIAGLQERKD